jgi:DNA-binding transcriptional LysR family regulator
VRVRLVRQGQGVAIVNSSAVVDGTRVRAIPVMQDGRPVGTWARVVWDPRRDLPSAAEDLIEDLVAAAKADYPGHTIRVTHLVPRPPEP